MATITYHPTGRARERILAFGMEGVGKTFAFLQIARACPDATFWIIDNDNSIERLLETDFDDLGVKEEYRVKEVKTTKGGLDEVVWERDKEFEDPSGNIIVFHASGWIENSDAFRIARERCERRDWIMIDSQTHLWDTIQSWFTEEVHGKGADQYFMQVRLEKEAAKKKPGRDAKTLGALDGWMDWPVINSTYYEQVRKYLVTPPCHLFLTCEQDAISKEDDKATKGLYGKHGVKPKGQKRNGHSVQTVLWFKASERRGTHTVTTIKDRGRVKMVDEDWEDQDFVDFYLKDKARWKKGFVR